MNLQYDKIRKNKTRIYKIPKYIIANLVNFLEIDDFFRLRMTSKYFYADEILNSRLKTLKITPTFARLNKIVNLYKIMSKVKTLDISEISPQHESFILVSTRNSIIP